MRLLFYFCFCVVPLWAETILSTSILDVDYRGKCERAGSISLTVTSDDFADASPQNPIYMRINLNQGMSLGESIGPSDDIYLALSLPLDFQDITVVAPPESVALVRARSGDSAIWLRIQHPTSVWLSNGQETFAPTEEYPVTFELGTTARESVSRGDRVGGNLPFNTRSASTTGNARDAISTILCLQLGNSDLTDAGIQSLGEIDVTYFDDGVDLGNGQYDAAEGTYLGPFIPLTGRIVRGKKRVLEVTPGALASPVDPSFSRALTEIPMRYDVTLSHGEGNNLLESFLGPESELELALPDEAMGFHLDKVAFYINGVKNENYWAPVSLTRTLDLRSYFGSMRVVYTGPPISLTQEVQFSVRYTVVAKLADAENPAVNLRFSLNPKAEQRRDSSPFRYPFQHAGCRETTEEMLTAEQRAFNPEYPRLITHLASADGSFQNTIRLANPTEEDHVLTLGFRDGAGVLLSSYSELLPAGTTVNRSLDQMDVANPAYAVVTGHPEALASVLFEAKTVAGDAAQIRASNASAHSWLLVGGDRDLTYDGVAVVNRGDQDADVTVEHRDGAWNLIQTYTIPRQVAPGGKELLVLNDLFTYTPGDSLVVRAAQPLSLTALRGDMASTYIWESRAEPLD